MDLLRGVILFILLRFVNGTSYYISETETDWTTASSNCKLAAPDLLSLPKHITLPQDADIDEVWVGYYRARTVLEYFGCTEKDNNIRTINVKADPGECLSVCGTKNEIGIFGKECFCLGIDTIKRNYQNITASVCNKSCDQLKGAACGGPAESTGDDVHTKSYMSLYRSIGTDDTSDAKDSDFICKYYDHQGFHWDRCNQPFQFICEKGSNVWIQNNDGGDLIYKSWIEATQFCFANNTRPSTYNNTENLHKPFGTAPLWTGIVRSYLIYKYSIDSSQSQHAGKFGILKRKNDQRYALKFKNKNGKRKSLCINETSIDGISSLSTAPSSTESERTAFTSGTTDTETVVAEKNTSVFSTTTTTTTISSSKTESTIQLKNMSDSSNVGAIVGATIAVVVVIAVIIIIVVLRKRGFKLPFLKEEKPSQSPSISRNNVGYVSEPIEFQQSTYNTSQNEYAEIDRNKVIDNRIGNCVVDCATETPEYEHDYFVLEKQEEETYGSTKPKLRNSDQNTFNPYDKLSLDEGLDYDYLRNGGIAGRNALGSDGTYNTTLGYSNLKTSKNAQNNEYNMVDDTEDTYNHTNLSSKNGLRVLENDYDAI